MISIIDSEEKHDYWGWIPKSINKKSTKFLSAVRNLVQLKNNYIVKQIKNENSKNFKN